MVCVRLETGPVAGRWGAGMWRGWGSLGSQCVLACGCWGIGDRGRAMKY